MANVVSLALGIVLAASGASVAAELDIQAAGPEELVFRWQRDKCHPEDFPDSPARAFRRDDGLVILSATHFLNYFLAGSDFEHLTPACRSRYVASMDPTPENFNARTWLQTFYTTDGKRVISIGSADYHGGWFKNCSDTSRASSKCWWSALVLAVSDDGGTSFRVASPPEHILARPQVRYSPEIKSPTGFFTTSNITKRPDGFYYTLAFTFGYRGQSAGNCLLRTRSLEDARSWLAWDGAGFDVAFPPPERGRNDAAHACVPVTNVDTPVRSLLWHAPTKQYVAILARWKRAKGAVGESVRIDFQFATSPNLIEWSLPKTFLGFDSKEGCARLLEDVAYPSVIDHHSDDRNYGTVGSEAFVYFTRFNRPNGCGPTMDRDLLRIPIRLISFP